MTVLVPMPQPFRKTLPDALQIADQFHLHQNLLGPIRNTVNTVIAVNINIPTGHSKEIPLSTESKEEERKKYFALWIIKLSKIE